MEKSAVKFERLPIFSSISRGKTTFHLPSSHFLNGFVKIVHLDETDASTAAMSTDELLLEADRQAVSIQSYLATTCTAQMSHVATKSIYPAPQTLPTASVRDTTSTSASRNSLVVTAPASATAISRMESAGMERSDSSTNRPISNNRFSNPKKDLIQYLEKKTEVIILY